MDNRFTFRQARREDLPSVLALYAQLGLDDGSVLEISHAESLWERMESYPDYHVHLALWEERIVGTWSLLVMDNLAHRGAPSAIVEDVVVDISCRGVGVGHAMMRHAMDLAREKGCYKLALTSNRNREAAHRFYEQLGFARHGYSFLIELDQPHA